jgi:hypothetical protein
VALASEALLAVSGLFPKKITRTVTGTAAEALPREWARDVKAFFDQEKPEKFRKVPRPDHEGTLDRLIAGISAEEQERLTKGLSDEAGLDYLAALNNAREYVQSQWPALYLDTPTGPQLLEPGPTAMMEASTMYATIDDPHRVVVDMLSGALTTAQVNAFKQVYPGLFDVLRSLVRAEIDRRLARRKSYRVPWRQERVLRVFLGLGPDMTLKHVEPKAPQMSSPDVKIDWAKSTATRTQRIDQK